MNFSSNIIDAIPLGLLAIDKGFYVVHANKLIQEWGNFILDRNNPTHVFELLPQLREPIFLKRIEWSLTAGSPSFFSPQLHPHILTSYLGDMTLRSFETTIVPVNDDESGTLMLLFVFSDVSMLVQQTREVEVLRKVAMNEIMEQKLREEEHTRLIGELRKALAEVKTLSGLIPICASCKNVRDDQGYWKKIEAYISEHSAANFTHGICPACAEKLYPGLDYPD